MQTGLTRLLDIRVPVVCSPMAGAAGGALAAAVTQGGGFGFIGAGHQPIDHLEREIVLARTALGGQKTGEILNVGIGLLLWRIESPVVGAQKLAEDFVRVISEAKVKAVWLSFGNEIERFVRLFREKEEGMGRKEGEKLKIFVMVGTVDHAVQVANWGEVDVVVCQGIEAGGHGLSAALPLLSLLPQIKAAYSLLPSTVPLPLLTAAGGLVSGSHLVSVLPYADGIILGTAFLATPESLYTPAQKDLILTSNGSDTLRTSTFDYCRDTLGFPGGVNGRAIGNEISKAGGEGKMGSSEWTEELKERYAQGAKEQDVARIVTWAGTSVGSIKKITPAAELVKEIEAEALATLDALLAIRE